MCDVCIERWKVSFLRVREKRTSKGRVKKARKLF